MIYNKILLLNSHIKFNIENKYIIQLKSQIDGNIQQLRMIQQENQKLLGRNQSQQSNQPNVSNSFNSNQIREVRLKKQLQFLNKYDYTLTRQQDGTIITIRNLWGTQAGQYQFGSSMVNKQLMIFLPNQYPFKQPTFKVDGDEEMSISELIDEWSPRFKIMEMVQLLKKRLQQRNELQHKLQNNIILHTFKNMPSLWVFLFIAILIRVCVGLGWFSGKSDWPNLGDFQAHRNWMSITVNRPITYWYTQLSEQPWWRIDYPPVAAYISYFFGIIYSKIEPQAMKIQRGYESANLIAYMRFTVLLIDCLFLFPAVYLICKQCSPIRYRNKPLFYALIFIILIKPDQILIDHGHFQYNCLMLGLILYAFYFMIVGRRYLCCFIFTIAINCKLMSVYFSLAFLAGLIGLACRKNWVHNKYKIVQQCLFFGVIVILTTFIFWIPWMHSYKYFNSVLQAIFPVHRGLYQLKVPNFWCISDVVIKWQAWLSKPFLTFLCFFFCVSFSLPSMFALIIKPSLKVLIIGFSCIAMTFFMFSYHVHQKSILVPLCIIPFMSQFASGSLVVDLVIGGMVGMHHLLKQDGQQMQYFILLIIYIVFANSFYRSENVFMNIYHPHNRSTPLAVSIQPQHKNVAETFHRKYFDSSLRQIYVYGGLIILHLGQAFISPPSRLPYLWHLLFAFYAFLLNTYFLVLTNWILIEQMKQKLRILKKQL